jgi:hypothetical protein
MLHRTLMPSQGVMVLVLILPRCFPPWIITYESERCMASHVFLFCLVFECRRCRGCCTCDGWDCQLTTILFTVGLGTFRLTGQEAYDATLCALQCGYRLIDTASVCVQFASSVCVFSSASKWCPVPSGMP